MSIAMPVNPHTGLYNVTHVEFLDAVAATEDAPLTREDGTLTRAGQEYVADVRAHGHEDCYLCPLYAAHRARRIGDPITFIDAWSERRTGTVTHVGSVAGFADVDGVEVRYDAAMVIL